MSFTDHHLMYQKIDKNVSNFALENSITGLEFFSCIPGSIGGAIRMNSGCYGYDVSKCILSIQTINFNGVVRSIKTEKTNFYYRGTNLSDDLIFLSATFKGRKHSSKEIKEKMSGNIIFDLRNIFDKNQVINLGFEYYGIGK